MQINSKSLHCKSQPIKFIQCVKMENPLGRPGETCYFLLISVYIVLFYADILSIILDYSLSMMGYTFVTI